MSQSEVPTRTEPETFTVRAIGYVTSDYADPADVRHRHDRWTDDVSVIRFVGRYGRLLGGLEGYSHAAILFWIHRARQWKMPKDHHKPKHVKVFATRMPVRPNPIGLSVVEVVEVSPGRGRLTVRGLDAVDGTPILDVKPYIANFDSVPEATVPDWVAEHLDSHFHGGPGHAHGASHDHAHGASHDHPPGTADDRPHSGGRRKKADKDGPFAAEAKDDPRHSESDSLSNARFEPEGREA